MKRIIKAGIFTFLLCLLCMPMIQTKAATGYDYVITDYHVDMKVTKQNTYQITEIIQVFFNKSRHGIYRDIPLLNHVKRSDGSENEIMARIENIRCYDNFELSRENDNCRIKIGDEDTTITGPKEYTISYDYIMGNDVLPDEDELYFNIIGNGWQTQISNVTFSIHMPEEFDEKKLGMSRGAYGEANIKGLSYYIKDNTIYGELDSSIVLQPYEGVNVRLSLPEGYFEKVENSFVLGYIGIGLAVLALILGFVFWYLFGRDDPVIESVEFYPPNGLNSLELAFAYKGSVDNNDVVSLLVYLAQKGYLKIEESGKKSFVITKVKEYDGNNPSEREFFAGLFANGRTEVRKSNLQDSFYKTVNKVKTLVDNPYQKRKIFYANSLNKSWIVWLLTLLAFVVCFSKPIGDYEFSYGLGIAMSVLIWAAVAFAFRFLFVGNIATSVKIFIFIFAAIVEVVLYFVLIGTSLFAQDGRYGLAYGVLMIATAGAMFFCAFMTKRTTYGTEMLGKIRGFRNFLKTAEKERLEALVEENPQYFYHILPYTYVLDLSSKWMKKFESIAIEPPHWYVGNDISAFDIIAFNHFMNSTMSQATTSMTSTPSSSDGGGFSGGGSGGGGGGSW